MRRWYLALTLAIAGIALSGWLALDWLSRRLADRLPRARIEGLSVAGRGIALQGLRIERHGHAVTIDRARLDWTRWFAPALGLHAVRVVGRLRAELSEVHARALAGRIDLTVNGEVLGQTVEWTGHADPLRRRVELSGVRGPLFVGDLAGRAVRIEAAALTAAGVEALGVSATGREVWFAGDRVELRPASCGWQVVVDGGRAWIPARAPQGMTGHSARPHRTNRGCSIVARDIEVLAHTPIGVRSGVVETASLADGVFDARGRTNGAEGRVIAPMDGHWAWASGYADLQSWAMLLGEERIEGHVRGTVDIVRAQDDLAIGATGRVTATVVHSAIAEAPVVIRDLEFTASASGGRAAGTVRIARLAKGGVEASAVLTWSPSTVRLTGALAPTDCQTVWRALPEALRGPYANARLSGRIAPRVDFKLPRTDAFKLTLDWKGPTICSVDALETAAAARPPARGAGSTADVDWLLRDFELPVRYATRPVTVGPGTPAYVPLGALPKWVPVAAIVSEDNAFNRGHALNLNLLRRALMFNLDRGRYVYGGSTIPQQLVKNLFLTRRKTLARKLQEALVALRVVQVVPKRRILELYLNCIEFAPNVYGIERAARHYFQKGARNLTPKEAAFLATAKPSPRYAAAMRRRGATPDTPHFREYMRRILSRMQKRGAISGAQAAAARPFRLFWRNGRSVPDGDSPRIDEHL